MPRAEMPLIETFKTIKDPIHGYISLTRTEYAAIQLPVMMRLHRLKMMAAGYLVYPGALATRFIHCVGAMHVASKMCYQLLGSMSSNDFVNQFGGRSTHDKLRLIQTVRLAALFHDLGHGPFSHAAEDQMVSSLAKVSSQDFEEALKLYGVKDPAKLPVHEYYSYKQVTTGEVKETIESMYSGISQDVGDLLVKNPSRKERNRSTTDSGLTILRSMISSHLDADRFDYLLRDSFMTGASFGSVDIDRLIMNLNVQFVNHLPKVTVHERAIGSIEDILDARFKMYKWVYNHHMVVARAPDMPAGNTGADRRYAGFEIAIRHKNSSSAMQIIY